MPDPLILINKKEIISAKTVKWSDITEAFPANPNGWHYGLVPGPTPFIQNLLTAYLFITPPDGVERTINLLTIPAPMYNVSTGLIVNPYLYQGPSIGLAVGASLPDGLHKLKQEVTGEYASDPVYNFYSEFTDVVYITETVKCCLTKLLNLYLFADSCKKEEEYYKKWLKGYLLYRGIINNTTGPCISYAKADELLVELQDLCISSGCDCGCS